MTEYDKLQLDGDTEKAGCVVSNWPQVLLTSHNLWSLDLSYSLETRAHIMYVCCAQSEI